jgi:hypothetical protein
MRSIRESVQNRQFLCRLAQNASDPIVVVIGASLFTGVQSVAAFTGDHRCFPMRRTDFPAMFGYERSIRHHARFCVSEWAAKEKVPETVAAALFLICETRRLHDATLQGENPT